MLFICVQTSSSMADNDDVMALFDDIVTFLDAASAEIQDSPDSLTTHFLVT